MVYQKIGDQGYWAIKHCQRLNKNIKRASFLISQPEALLFVCQMKKATGKTELALGLSVLSAASHVSVQQVWINIPINSKQLTWTRNYTVCFTSTLPSCRRIQFFDLIYFLMGNFIAHSYSVLQAVNRSERNSYTSVSM